MLSKQLSNTLRRMETSFCKYTNSMYVKSADTGREAEVRLEFEETYRANQKMPIPSYDEMKKEMLEKISFSGFSYTFVSPEEANCVVRIYRKELEINAVRGGLCGADCFVKDFFGKWTRIDKDGNSIEMTHGRHYLVTYWTSLLTVYEKTVAANYYDVYLKVEYHK